VLNRDALDVIRQQDGPDTLFYLDPPYLPETRAAADVYAHEMTREQHVELLKVLSAIEGRFVLSGYRNNLYDRAAELCGWARRDFELANHSAGGEKKRRVIESVWLNYEV
jgi:DNA adenine methylase